MAGDPREEGGAADPARLSEAQTRALVLGARAGDEAQFLVLYERLAPALYTWAQIRIRPELRQWIDPQDLVQEVWCRAWRRREDLDPERVSFRYWIFRVAKNVLLEAHRKVRNPAFARGLAGTTTRLLALQEVPDAATGVSQRVAHDEGCRLLEEWVAGLEETDRTLVLHLGMEGLSQAEVASRLHIGREALAKRWQRLRQRLEELKLPRTIQAALEP